MVSRNLAASFAAASPTGNEFRSRRASTPDTLTERVEISVHSSLEECEGWWRAAFANGVRFVFQAFEWHAAYQATIGTRDRVEPCIVRVADLAGRTLMVLPLGIHRERGMRVLRFLGGVVTDYNAPIMAADLAGRLDSGDFAALWQLILQRLPRFDLAWLRRMPATIEGVDNPMIGLPGAAHTQDAYAATLPDSMEAFKAARKAKLFSDARRQRRRLAALGAVAEEIPVPPDRMADILDVLARQKSRRHVETGAVDMFAQPGYAEFYRHLTHGRFRFDAVHLSSITVGDTVVATHWGLLFDGRFYYILPSYEGGDWARYSCGRILLEDLADTLITQRARVFDMTVGDESYKLDWSDHSLPLYECQMALSAKGMAFLAYQRLREGLKQHPTVRRLARHARAALRLRSPQNG